MSGENLLVILVVGLIAGWCSRAPRSWLDRWYIRSRLPGPLTD